MTNCINCSKELLADHSFCPSCGYDLRQYKKLETEQLFPKERAKRKSFLDILRSPKGSVWLSFLVGICVIEMRTGYYKNFTNENANIASLFGSIIGGGAGFLIFILIPTLSVSLIVFAIRRKFPKKIFVTMIYVFTIIATIFFLSPLFRPE